MDGPTRGLISVIGLGAGRIGGNIGRDLYRANVHRLPARLHHPDTEAACEGVGAILGAAAVMVPLIGLANRQDRR